MHQLWSYCVFKLHRNEISNQIPSQIPFLGLSFSKWDLAVYSLGQINNPEWCLLLQQYWSRSAVHCKVWQTAELVCSYDLPTHCWANHLCCKQCQIGAVQTEMRLSKGAIVFYVICDGLDYKCTIWFQSGCENSYFLTVESKWIKQMSSQLAIMFLLTIFTRCISSAESTITWCWAVTAGSHHTVRRYEKFFSVNKRNIIVPTVFSSCRIWTHSGTKTT